jgi:hypothetical protein
MGRLLFRLRESLTALPDAENSDVPPKKFTGGAVRFTQAKLSLI